MTNFNKRARAEASKYQHMISPKARHKYNFACGAGDKGNKGFQPGNTCGGDGDGTDDAGDQGGGDKASSNPVMSTGSGKIEIQLTDEAVRDGATIHNTDMSHISDELLKEELMEYGFEPDSDNLADRESMEAALLEVMDEEAPDAGDLEPEAPAGGLDPGDVAIEVAGFESEEEFKDALSDWNTRNDTLQAMSDDELRKVADSIADEDISGHANAILELREAGSPFAGPRAEPPTQPDAPAAADLDPEDRGLVDEMTEAPGAEAGAVDASEAVGSGGEYEASLPTGYEIEHAGSGERPWQISGSEAGGETYEFEGESDAEIGSMALALYKDGEGEFLDLDDPGNLRGFASYVTDYQGEYREVSSERVKELMGKYEEARIGRYEGGITEYASQLIDDMGGAKEAMGDSHTAYVDYQKWNDELESVDEGYGARERSDGKWEVYDRQDEDVEPTVYDYGYEAKESAEETNNELLTEMVGEGDAAKHPGSGESYADRYLDVEGWARDLEIGGDIVDLGEGNLIWGSV